MAILTPNTAAVFNRGESIPVLQGKQTTNQAAVFNRGESIRAILSGAVGPTTTIPRNPAINHQNPAFV